MPPADISRHRLRGHRDGVGLSPADVAAATGRPEATVLAWEAGTAVPEVPDLDALARLYDVAVEDFGARHRDDRSGLADYTGAALMHWPPLTDQEIAAVAATLRRVVGRRDGNDHAGRPSDRAPSIFGRK